MSRGTRGDWALLPNLLTMSRLVAAALIPTVFLAAPRPMADALALSLFVYASITDYLDGYLARRLGQTSDLGARLDALADKALLLATLAPLCALAFPNAPWFWVGAGVIAVREIGVTALRRWRPHAAGLKVRRDAKWKTAAQMTAVSVLLAAELVAGLREPPLAEALRWLGVALFAAAVALSATTGVAYLRAALAVGPAPEPPER